MLQQQFNPGTFEFLTFLFCFHIAVEIFANTREAAAYTLFFANQICKWDGAEEEKTFPHLPSALPLNGKNRSIDFYAFNGTINAI